MQDMQDTMSKLVPLFPAAELEEGHMRQANLPDGHALAVYRVDDRFYATDDRCTHGEVSLTEEGTLDGCIVECSFHFGSFNVTTGEPVAMPCEVALKIYRVQVENGVVHVEI
jgi:nitrite reductase/ring-hydroxylating ferredoxin subunit